MVHRNGRYVIRRDNNVVEVDFSREPDPPAPDSPALAGCGSRLRRTANQPGRLVNLARRWLAEKHCLSGCRARWETTLRPAV